MPYLQITEVALVHYNVVKNGYQQYSRVLYTFVASRSIGKLFDFSPKNHIEFSYIEVCFTDQNSKPLETEDKINITIFHK